MHIIAGILLGIGIFTVLSSVMKFTDKRHLKAMNRYKNSNDDVLKEINNFINKYLLKIIKINDIKRRKYEKDLFFANINATPEEFVAQGITDLIILCSIGGILLLFNIFSPINKILSFICIIYAIVKFSDYFKEPIKKIIENRKKIDNELYKFVSCIEQELIIDTDIIRILENFKNRTNKEFKRELEITLSEIRTTSEINALIKLEARVNSSMLSEVINGLISLTRGLSNREYFTNLVNKFESIYLNEKRKNNNKCKNYKNKRKYTTKPRCTLSNYPR